MEQSEKFFEPISRWEKRHRIDGKFRPKRKMQNRRLNRRKKGYVKNA